MSVQNDNRFFAKTKVDGEEILALLDTGVSANSIGIGTNAFLINRTGPIRKLSEECVRVASGGETQVTLTVRPSRTTSGRAHQPD